MKRLGKSQLRIPGWHNFLEWHRARLAPCVLNNSGRGCAQGREFDVQVRRYMYTPGLAVLTVVDPAKRGIRALLSS